MKRISITIFLLVITTGLAGCGFCGSGCGSACGSSSYTAVSCCNSTPW